MVRWDPLAIYVTIAIYEYIQDPKVTQPFATRTPTKDKHMTINCNSNVKCSWAGTHLPNRPIPSALWLEPLLILNIIYTKVVDKSLVDEATKHDYLRFFDIYSSVVVQRLRKSPKKNQREMLEPNNAFLFLLSCSLSPLLLCNFSLHFLQTFFFPNLSENPSSRLLQSFSFSSSFKTSHKTPFSHSPSPLLFSQPLARFSFFFCSFFKNQFSATPYSIFLFFKSEFSLFLFFSSSNLNPLPENLSHFFQTSLAF